MVAFNPSPCLLEIFNMCICIDIYIYTNLTTKCTYVGAVEHCFVQDFGSDDVRPCQNAGGSHVDHINFFAMSVPKWDDMG